MSTPADVKSRILVIDDEAGIRDSMRRTLEYQGYQFIGASSGQEGIALIDRDPPDLVFLDIKMPGMDGLEVLDRIKAAHPEVPVVMVSGHGTAQTGYDASKRGASGFIEKPFSEPVLLERIEKELTGTRTETAYRALRQEIDSKYQMVGNSAALRKVEEAIRKAAPTHATVLLQGESGVGKELVARTIHRLSPRSRERFVQVNCAAIPEELIESELFGHEKGSFTGATERQVGKFEQADRGTIFLDEVGDMSLKTQAKALRVLQEGEVERLGSAKTVNVDVRVIAATNKNLEAEIEKGNFREDLYFRLAVIPIYVPPLRERPEDVPLLVKHFVNQLGRENNRRPKQITPRGDGRAEAASMARQHPRAAKHDRAPHHHDGGGHDRRAGPSRVAAIGQRLAAARRRIRPRGSPPAPARVLTRARCASSRNPPSAPGSSKSCAKTGGTFRRPPK